MRDKLTLLLIGLLQLRGRLKIKKKFTLETYYIILVQIREA